MVRHHRRRMWCGWVWPDVVTVRHEATPWAAATGAGADAARIMSGAAAQRRNSCSAPALCDPGAMTDDERGRRRSDSAQLVRQWALLRLLAESGRAFSVKELSEQLGASKPTIQRDLATLETHFALIEELEGKQKKLYRIDESIRALKSVQFGTMELLALHAAANAAPMEGSPFAQDLRGVITKLRGFLSPRHNGGLDALARVFVPHVRGHVDYGAHQDVIDDISDAIARRRKCRAVYHAAWNDTTKEHTFRPLRLVWNRGSLYLLCAFDGVSDITTLAVQRIQELELLADTFPPPNIDVAAHVRKAFGIFVSDDEQDVEIWFDKQIAWRIEERTFHPDEDKERQRDGRLVYRVRSSAQWEIVPWVLSFGGLAELRSPTAWRQAVAQAARDQAALHDSSE